ncbi:MAG: tetratricopeptide repeat protein [Candidatus Krumholzibacteria bacterium]|nr:tetratricopeptide repeat protein [Candidatus Krumholzibacteria bacterium]
MRRSPLSVPIIFLLLAALSCAAAQDDPEARYQEFRSRLVEMYNAKEYEEIAALIEENYDRFTGKYSNMSYNMALVCMRLEDYDRAIRYLEKAHEKGHFFNVWAFQGEQWAPLREREEFDGIIARNLAMKDEAQKRAKPQIEVSVPEDFDTTRTYPLFIALHGGGENIGVFRPNWRSDVMEREFIIAWVQSSQVVSMNGFSWEEQETTRREVREAYEKVCAEYPVDAGEVLIGGFSSGGYGSLVVTFFEEAVPVKGFVSLCPPMPENVTAAEVAAARERGVRGTIITTELDNRVPAQRAMADLLRDNGLQYQFVMTLDIGHWYPGNFPALLDRAIEHIRSD